MDKLEIFLDIGPPNRKHYVYETCTRPWAVSYRGQLKSWPFFVCGSRCFATGSGAWPRFPAKTHGVIVNTSVHRGVMRDNVNDGLSKSDKGQYLRWLRCNRGLTVVYEKSNMTLPMGVGSYLNVSSYSQVMVNHHRHPPTWSNRPCLRGSSHGT